MNCNRRAPFSDNYCRDFAIYHGGIACCGALVAVIGIVASSPITTVVGAGLILAAVITATGNYLIDKSFDER